MSRTIKIEQLDKELPRIMERLDKNHAKALAMKMKQWPLKFQNRAVGFYRTVLRQPTGRLIRSITGFTRRLSQNVVAFGLRAGSDSDPVKYARALHDGFHGMVNVRAHSRRGTSGVRAHTRQMNIRARKFLEIPIRALVPALIQDLRTMDKF